MQCQIFVTLTLELDAAIQSFHMTMMRHKTTFGCKRFSSSVDTVETYFYCTSPHCDHNHEDSKPIFLKELWLWMIHHHTKFGYKRFSSSVDMAEKYFDCMSFHSLSHFSKSCRQVSFLHIQLLRHKWRITVMPGLIKAFKHHWIHTWVW